MPAKGKAASTSSSDDVKHNTRASASTPPIEEPVPGLQAWLTSIAIPSLQATIQAGLDSRFQALESEIAELKAAQVTQPPAPAPAITPAVTPAIEPSASFKSIPFRADEVGYFDPDLDADDGDMVTIGKDLWFRDVFLFTDRLKDVAVIKADAIRSNWTSCLRGTALSWYQDEWEAYDTWRQTMSLDTIIDELISRFRDPPDKALRKLNSLQFTITSIQEGKKPASYVHQVIRAARNAGFDSHQNQLSFAYDHLQVELRTQIDRPTVNTTVSSFIQQLTNKYINWQELYSLPARRFAYQGNYGQYRQYDQVQYASQQQVMPQQQRDYYMQRNDKDKYNRHVPRAIKPPPNYSSQNRQPWKATTGPPIIKAEANHRAAKVTDVDDDDTDEVMQEPQGYAFNYDAHNRDSPFTPFDSYDPYFR
jgi:hypothetical protein